MYRGEYSHTIDAKGRMSIPAKLKNQLGDSFVITRSMDGCLMAFDTEEWDKFEEKLKSLPFTNKDARTIVRYFTGGASDVDVDAQGRILVPAYLREYAGLTKDAVVIGMGNRVEIWSRERYEADATYDNMDEVAAALESMGISF